MTSDLQKMFRFPTKIKNGGNFELTLCIAENWNSLHGKYAGKDDYYGYAIKYFNSLTKY